MRKFMWLIAGLSLACNLPAQVEPNAGQWKTWVIASGGALRLPAPPDADGTAAEIQWLKDCVAKRNQAALAQIHLWDAGAPGYRWMQLTEQLAVSEGLTNARSFFGCGRNLRLDGGCLGLKICVRAAAPERDRSHCHYGH